MNLSHLTASEIIAQKNRSGLSVQGLLESLQAQIDQHGSKVNAFIRLNRKISEQIPAFEKRPRPVPIAIKDNMCIKNTETTCCSAILKNFVPPYNATVIEKLNNTGIPILGQTNMDEFAFGSSTETSCYGPTFNPWDLSCVPGGSSGGSAAAVAANQAPWALGSDTGGSIRQPAAFCGVVGVKPTYGRVSRYGLIAFASSLDQIGPITKDVRDAALLLEIISGYDPNDSTSVDLPVPDYTQEITKEIKGLKVGIPKEYFVEGIQPEVKQAVEEAISVLKKAGVIFKDISLPHTEYCVATYYIIATAEASSNLARYDGVQYGLRCLPSKKRKTALVDMYEETRAVGFGDEAKRRIMLGTYSLSSGYYDAYYLRGQKVRTLIKQDFDIAFKEVDAILTPTSPTTAFKVGERKNNPLAMYLSDIYTISANLSGIPAISLPCGFSESGMPIGLQLMAKPFNEETMLRLAYHYEQVSGWHKKRVEF